MSKGGAILQIVPRAPGDCDGVGDYARQLARCLQQSHGIRTTFVSAAPIKAPKTDEGFDVLSPLRSISALVRPPTSLLLHYVNYGYNAHGVPIWLPAVLRRLQSAGRGRLVTVFHELYASGSWRQSAFWLRPVQMRIARSLAGMSAISIVSNEIQREQLERLAPSANIVVQPVASNFGEPDFSATELVDRDPHRWVICGGTELIQRSLLSFLKAAPLIADSFTPRELCIIGGEDRKEIRARLAEQKNIQTRYYPDVDAKEASNILSTCAFAWVDYFHVPGVPMAAILKSSAFAGLCAHGIIPVFPHDGSLIHHRHDALPGPFFVAASGQNLPRESERAQTAQAIHAWYGRNASSRDLAETVAAAISRPL